MEEIVEDPSSSKAFTPLATLYLQSPHVLHPQACNPTMDLVVLIGQGGQGKVGPEITKLALWRMSGTAVWNCEMKGRVRGLTWSHDGLILSILLSESVGGQEPTMSIHHISVHSGVVFKSINLDMHDVGPSSSPNSSDSWWDLTWTESKDDWPMPQRGSAGMIIDSLPLPTPVDPPQPPNALPFILPNAQKAKKVLALVPHPKLESFPSLLPTLIPFPPHILNIIPPDRSRSTRLLTGTLPLETGLIVDELYLKLAKSCGRLSGFLDIVMRGLEVLDHTFKEGEKQTMIWREELEECGEQRGLSKAEVHAHLFQLLITGRGSPAVIEWLGNRLTGRTITKWEASLDNRYKSIQDIFSASVGPAIERVILLLEEMRGWSKVYSHLALNTETVERTLAVAVGFAKLIERMRQQAQEEFFAAIEWMNWLKYEVGRAAAQDVSTDTFLPSLCDTKLVWYYMKNGFVQSPLLVHFPQQFRTRPPDDTLPEGFDANPRPAQKHMSEVLGETIRSLTGRSKRQESQVDPTPQGPEQDVSIDTSIDMVSLDASGIRASSPEIPSSPDTVSQHPTNKEEVEVPRVLELEPWVWANTLMTYLKDLVTPKESAPESPTGWAAVERGLIAHRVVNGLNMTAFMYPRHEMLHILAGEDRCARVEFPGMVILALSFFDDVELALLVQITGGARMLVTVKYAEFSYENIVPVKALSELSDYEYEEPGLDLETVSPKFHYLDNYLPWHETENTSIALNGRKGRRVGCVMMHGGMVVEVLDMEEDDGDDDEQEMSGIVEE